MSEVSVQQGNQCAIYFQPRQILFHAHGNLSDNPGVISDLIAWANGIASSKGISLQVNDNSEGRHIFDFNPLQQPVLSVKPEALTKTTNIKPNADNIAQEKLSSKQPEYKSPPVRVPPPFSFVFLDAASSNWMENLDFDNNEKLAQEQKDLLNLILELDKRRGEAPVNLEVVSPNWLMSGSSEPGGTGGPGGPPEHVEKSEIRNHHIALKAPPDPAREPSLAQAFAAVSEPDAGADVVVAILDTSYRNAQIADIYRTWVTDRPDDKHPLVEALLGPGGCLEIHDDRSVDSYLPGVYIPGHRYDMTDHGFFIAGIINSIAPKAELHLYEVLNKHGLGDLRTIANALQDVTNRFQGRPLVVNLSLTMNMPLEEKHLYEGDLSDVGRAIVNERPWGLARLVARVFNWLFKKDYLCTCDSWFDRQARPFEWICDLVYSLESRVIAAAGNNRKAGRARPMALYPAAFERAFGVGAIPRNIPPTGPVPVASYTNLADMPPRVGITTLGGEMGARNGIRGLYIGAFPDGRANENGWAWWSGTSFATPIISGMTAVVLSNLNRGSAVRRYKTEDAVSMLYRLQTRETSPWQEDVLEVTQP